MKNFVFLFFLLSTTLPALGFAQANSPCDTCIPICETLLTAGCTIGAPAICSQISTEYPLLNQLACNLLTELTCTLTEEAKTMDACGWSCSLILSCNESPEDMPGQSTGTHPTTRAQPSISSTSAVTMPHNPGSTVNVRDQPLFPRSNIVASLAAEVPVEILGETCGIDGYRWARIELTNVFDHQSQTHVSGRGWIVRYFLSPNIEEENRCCNGSRYVHGNGCCAPDATNEACLQ